MKKMFYKVGLLLIGLASTTYAQINTPSGAVVPFGSNPGYGSNGILPANLPTTGTYRKSQDAADAYNEWKANYTEVCSNGIRVKFDEPNRTVSEGIAYGMLLAAYAADKNLFDGLWKYYKANSNGRGVMHWRIDGCSGVSGQNGATDAELDAAWALLIAETQWPTATNPYDYGNEANTLLNAVKQYEIASNGQAINGDGWGFGDPCRNPSYQSPAYYRVFAQTNAANAGTWNSAISGGYALLNNNAHPTTGLVSDWSDPNGVRNTCNPGGLGYAATNGYGYDACRNIWRMAQDVLWNGPTTASSASSILNKVTTWMNGKGASNVGGPLNQDGSNYSGWARNATFVSTFALAPMATSNQVLLNDMYSQVKNTKDPIKNSTLSGYFGNTLRCVSLFMLTGNFWKYGTTSEKEINIRVGTADVLHNATYDFQNTQTTAGGNANGKTVTFTAENLGFTALTLGPAPVVAVTGTDAALFTVTQPTNTSLALGATTTFTVNFKPTTNGLKTCTLTVKSNDADETTYTIYLQGTGTATATSGRIVVRDTTNLVANNGAAIDMGTFTNGQKGYKVFKISNTGDGPLNITAATFSSTAFTAIDPLSYTTPLIIPVNGTRLITVGYSSAAASTNVAGSVTFSTDDPNNASFKINLTASSAACSVNSQILWDFDGIRTVVQPWAPKSYWATNTANPVKNAANPSPTVATFVRKAIGDYDIIRLYNCGSSTSTTVWPPSLTTFPANSNFPTLQMLVYSPAAGIQITVAPQKPGTAKDVWEPLKADYSSNITRTTTKAKQWELITFDLGTVIAGNLAADFKALDIQIDPTRQYAAGKDSLSRTFYIDRISYGPNPCIADSVSGVLNDFDNHVNTSLEYNVAAFSQVANPVADVNNGSANVGKFVKAAAAAEFSDGLPFVGCNNKINLKTKKYVSMLVYAPVAGRTIQVSAKVPDGADADTYADDAASSTQKVTVANAWKRLYFDLSAVSAANLSKVFQLQIFIDPTAAPVAGTYYIDDIRLEDALPCTNGILTTGVLNDFDANRFVDLAFAPTGTYNDVAANPSTIGNTSAGVAQFVRAADGSATTAGIQPDILRYKACGPTFEFAKGRSVITTQVYAPTAGTEVILSLKNAADVEVAQKYVKMKAANAWETLSFDFSDIIGNTTVAAIDLILDPNNTNTATAAARTYYVDNIRYSELPEISLKRTATNANIANGDTLDFGAIAVGDSVVVDVTILNNGGSNLVLAGNGASALKFLGADSVNFQKVVTPQFSTTISSASAVGFTVKFKPAGGGKKISSIQITNNDGDETPYYINLKGVATCPTIDAPTVAAPQLAYCSGATAAALSATATGNNVLYWYTVPTNGTSSATAPVPSTATAGLTTYYVSQGLNGCESARSSIAVSVTARPTVVVSADQPQVEGPNASVTVTASEPGTWSQVAGPVTTGITYTPSETAAAVTIGGLKQIGTYTFKYTIAAGTVCPAVSDEVALVVTQVTSSSDQLLGTAVNIYPNPAADKLNIEANGLNEVSITVTDVYGKVLFSGNQNTAEVSMTEKAAGMYIVQVKSGNNVLTKTVFKK